MIMRALFVSILIVCSVLILGQTVPFVGTYDVIRLEKGKPVDNKSLPPGQVMILELIKDGAFQMRDFLSGFEGSWKVSDKRLILTFKSGPAGKLRKQDVMTVQPSPDRSRLVIVSPKSYAGQLEFHWNPKAIETWNRRLSETLKKTEQGSKKPGG